LRFKASHNRTDTLKISDNGLHRLCVRKDILCRVFTSSHTGCDDG
jgi:hypothetical protein